MSAAGEKEIKYVRLTFLEDFLLSGVAASISKTAAAPLERVKMVVQNQDEMIRSGALKEPFKGIVHCTQWIMSNEGLLSFWKSNFTNCLRYFPTQALNFSFKGQIKRIDHFKVRKDDAYTTKLYRNIMGGGLAGGGSLCFVYSLDYARTRLANDLKSSKKGGQREFSGLIDVYAKTLKSDGFVGIYRGFVISFVGIFIYRGFYFGLYDTIMPMFPPEYSNMAVRFCVGYMVTVTAGLASYPIDTVRRRMMMTSGNKSLQYSSSIACAAAILKNEGFSSYFKGAFANILRGVAGAGVLALFDTFKESYVAYAYGPEYRLASK
jgi:solute carrier family 25 (adenine nucleotide translocator) protein 4/5/6/31